MRSNTFIIRAILLFLMVGMPLSFVLGQGQEGFTRKLQFMKNGKKRQFLPFELVHNLVIIPVRINGSDTLKVILDTGVSHTIITELTDTQSLSLNYIRKIEVFGYGQGEKIEAYHSASNIIELPHIAGRYHDVIVPVEDIFHLSTSLGVVVNGIVGFDIFDSFVVEIDYDRKHIVLNDPKRFNYKKLKKGKWKELDIEIRKRKPFVTAKVVNKDGEVVDVTMLVDSGASHAISMFPEFGEHIESHHPFLPAKTIDSFLGVGLNGEVHGQIGRVPHMEFAGYQLPGPIGNFPDANSIGDSTAFKDRNGSIGGAILKRFDVVFDYASEKMYLKPNRDFKDEFKFNLSGLEIGCPLPGLPVYEILNVQEHSQARKVGLEKGDQIISINGNSVSRYSLNEILELFQSRPGRVIRIGVQKEERDEIIVKKITLKDPI